MVFSSGIGNSLISSSSQAYAGNSALYYRDQSCRDVWPIAASYSSHIVGQIRDHFLKKWKISMRSCHCVFCCRRIRLDGVA